MELPDFLSHLSLSSIAPIGSSRLYLVSAQSWCKVLLVRQYWHVHVLESIREYHLLVHPDFTSSVPHVLSILICEMRGKVTIQVTFRICSKQLIVFLYSSHQAFSPGVLFVSMCPQLWGNSVLFYQRDYVSIVVHTCPMHLLTSVSIDKLLMPRYVNWSMYFGELTLKR